MVGRFQEVQARRREWAAKTREEIEALPVHGSSGLRSVLSELGVTGEIDRVGDSGRKVRISAARKADLVEALWVSLAAERAETVILEELTEEELQAMAALGTEQNVETETDLGQYATEYVQKLYDLTAALWDASTETYNLPGAKFVNLSLGIARDLETRRSRKTGELISSETVRRYKSFLRRMMAEQMETLLATRKDSARFCDKLRETFVLVMGGKVNGRQVRGQVDEALDRHTAVKRQHEAERTIERGRVNSKVVSMERLLDRAIAVLGDLTDDTNLAAGQHWVDVVIALLVVTGRRPAEIQSQPPGGIWFDAPIEHGEGWVSWHNQLKEREKETAGRPYDIPVPVSLRTLQNAMRQLDRANKIAPNPTKAHKIYSTYLSRKCPQWDELIDFQTRPLDKDGSERTVTPKDFRPLYALRYKSLGRGASLAEVGRLLGHGDRMITTYSLDFEYATTV